jgi:hypothetical protein
MTISINGTRYPTLSDAISGPSAGDTIDISAGSYSEDFPKIFHDLTIQGTGGLARLTPVGQPSNGEAALVQDTTNLTLINLEISGVTVPDANGAAVRFESGTVLSVSNDWFHDNQDGILTSGSLPGSTVDITNSEFNNNGNEVGNTHNIYIGEVAQLSVTGSYFHDALGGHEIKSRAENNTITNDRIQDGPSADTSYGIDLPNGGNAIISNDVIEKGPNSSNGAVIHFGGELSPVYASSSLTITDNVVIDFGGHGRLFLFNQSVDAFGHPIVPVITGNTFYGITEAELSDQPVIESNNTFLPLSDAPTLDTSHPFIACFLRGTMIATPHGEKRVEDLRIGDRVLTMVGGMKRIKWIGRRSYPAEVIARWPQLRPVVVCKDAVSDGFPKRDLVVSPQHALYVDGYLIPAAALTNRRTIYRRDDITQVNYYHVELDEPNVIFSDGMPTESFVDRESREMFDNVDEYYSLYEENQRALVFA